MASTVTICNSFRHELLAGVHKFDGTHTYKIALFTSAAALSAATTAYSATNEATGTGYTAGGAALTPTVSTTGTTAYFGFADVTWATSTITARYALIYNTTASNKAVAVILLDNTPADVSSSAGNFTVDFPVTDATNAFYRIS